MPTVEGRRFHFTETGMCRRSFCAKSSRTSAAVPKNSCAICKTPRSTPRPFHASTFHRPVARMAFGVAPLQRRVGVGGSAVQCRKVESVKPRGGYAPFAERKVPWGLRLFRGVKPRGGYAPLRGSIVGHCSLITNHAPPPNYPRYPSNPRFNSPYSVIRALFRISIFGSHDGEEIGPRMLARIAKKTGRLVSEILRLPIQAQLEPKCGRAGLFVWIVANASGPTRV